MARRWVGVGVTAAAVVLGTIWAVRSPATTAVPTAPEAAPVAPPRPLAVAAEIDCPAPPGAASGTRAPDAGRDSVRASAQRGLSFLQTRAAEWNGAHACYGCHVHAVTVEALSVGRSNGYDVDPALLGSLVAAMTTGPGGTRTAEGMDYAHGHSLVAAARGFGGASFARYDALVDGGVRDDLLEVAAQLLELQQDDGGLTDPEAWVNPPVGTGSRLQLTAQAVSTWRQAHDRTADEAWLASIARAEDWLSGQLAALDPDSADLQQLNYALTGLLDAGGTVSEGTVGRLVDGLRRRQAEAGGWALQHGAAPDAYATGQTLYTLRRLGLSDGDPAIARGTAWLASNQTPEGGWRAGGAEKAEAMWAVLGLVSVDVLTVSLDGLTDGQHVSGDLPVTVHAAANGGGEVRQVELWVDDQPVARTCGDTLEASLDAARLTSGRHIVEARGVDGDGEVVRRRLDVYAGTHYLVGLGTRWDDGGTRIGFRSVAPPDRPGTVALEILALNGDAVGDVVHTEQQPAREGAMQFWWSDDRLGSRFLARLTWRDATGAAVHQVEHRFVHADPVMQATRFGNVGGKVELVEGLDAENALVELLNAAGQVIGSTRTTSTGSYQFKNLDDGQYKVRVSQEGRAAKEAEVQAAPAAAAQQDFAL